MKLGLVFLILTSAIFSSCGGSDNPAPATGNPISNRRNLGVGILDGDYTWANYICPDGSPANNDAYKKYWNRKATLSMHGNLAIFTVSLSGKLPINSGINCNIITQNKIKYLPEHRVQSLESNVDCKCTTAQATKIFCDALTDDNSDEFQLIEYTSSNSTLTMLNLSATEGGCDNGAVETLVFKKN